MTTHQAGQKASLSWDVVTSCFVPPPPLLLIPTSGGDNGSAQCKCKIMIQQFKKTQVDYVFPSTALHCDLPSATVQHAEIFFSAWDASLCPEAHDVFAAFPHVCKIRPDARIFFFFLSLLNDAFSTFSPQSHSCSLFPCRCLTPGHCCHLPPSLCFLSYSRPSMWLAVCFHHFLPSWTSACFTAISQAVTGSRQVIAKCSLCLFTPWCSELVCSCLGLMSQSFPVASSVWLMLCFVTTSAQAACLQVDIVLAHIP